MTESPAAIDGYRDEIDGIDSELLKLLNRRTQCALAIGRIKKDNGLPVFVPDREQKVLKRLAEENAGPLTTEGLGRIFTGIFEEMKRLEEEP